jgi:imidazolonepropionase-like amidohydrolase
MHVAGIPIVADTDGSGLELIPELEIHVEAGFTPAEALATATIAPAELVGQGGKTGSIEGGKAADQFLVEGDPSKARSRVDKSSHSLSRHRATFLQTPT